MGVVMSMGTKGRLCCAFAAVAAPLIGLGGAMMVGAVAGAAVLHATGVIALGVAGASGIGVKRAINRAEREGSSTPSKDMFSF